MDFLRKMVPGGVERYLEGIEFPIEKRELTERLQRNGVPGPVVDQVRRRLPEGRFSGPQGVLKRLRR
ncbi:DUF2795 domain-containing protein [Rubrobacter tropicus]|uniref:DUF2795 domain-containing protein n=1 Tax=Rubrobacter tropicus TaxID=2653851 RepID=A0A6G8Q6K1_9ACTN|nr:DUF2795 domain-containing protein [Rubrobacter tropicus]QIN82105.1 DUF2795 domain-containing protein [Rubrobacter tropicus]